MPITEEPKPSEKPAPDLLGANRSKGKYSSFEAHELITLVEDLEDDRARARVREGIWISVIAHLLLFWFIAYGPHVLFHQPRVVNPADVLAQRDKINPQFLDLPPDALKQLKQKKTDIISDKDRIAQSKNPTLDKKTIDQLQAMKAAGPPEQRPGPPAPPTPQPQQQAQQSPVPPAPQPGQQQPRPQSQPLQTQQQAQLENAPAAPTQPDFSKIGGGTARDQVRDAARQAAQSGQGGGDMGMGAPSRHPGNVGGFDILSDTMGVDFGPYLTRLKYLIEHAWWPLIPEEARPPLNKKGVTMIRFRIGKDGSLQVMNLDGRSGTTSLDRAAWGGVTGASPFPPLPTQFKGPYLEIRGAFLYNLRPEDMH
jgi:outer membrane biosynthesis protein TonB